MTNDLDKTARNPGVATTRSAIRSRRGTRNFVKASRVTRLAGQSAP